LSIGWSEIERPGDARARHRRGSRQPSGDAPHRFDGVGGLGRYRAIHTDDRDRRERERTDDALFV